MIALALLLALAPAANAGWTVLLHEKDVTNLAAPIDRGDLPVVNVSALADSLRLHIDIADDVINIVDATGTRWRTRSNAVTLEAEMGGRSLTLRSPMLKLGTGVYLPVEIVADLAGLQLAPDPDKRKLALQAKSAIVERTTPREDGWDNLVITKSASELAAMAKVDGTTGVRKTDSERLPSATDALRLNVGMGYVQGNDGALQLSGAGRLSGLNVSVNSLITAGQHGLLGRNGQLSLTDDEFGWGVDLGNLSSDLFGGLDGIRYRWRGGNDHWRSIAIYHNTVYNDQTPLVAYRDEVALGEHWRFGGEAASDGSLLVKGRYQDARLYLTAFGRWMSGQTPRSGTAGIGDSAGAFAAYQLGHGVQLYGGFSESQRETSTDQWGTIALRYPLWRGTDLVLEHSRNFTSQSRNNTTSAMVLWPLGPIRLLTRYQWGDSTQSSALGWIGRSYRELMATMAFAAGKRLSFDYQMSTRWQQDANSREWAQLVSTYRLSSRTKLQVVSNFPHFSDPERLNIRLTQQLRDDLALSVEYGQLYSYQGYSASHQNRGFMVLLTRSFELRTPSRGGEVCGRVLDEVERPVGGATVYLGEYRTVTNADGGFRFTRVPPGTYELYLDARTLPANMLTAEGRRTLAVSSDTRERTILHTIPLGAVIGMVYIDTNGNGHMDKGEGVSNIAIGCDTLVTASRADGKFRFDNVSPGAHTVRLLKKNLPEKYELDSAEEMAITLSAGGDVITPVFRVKLREKPVIYQSLL